MPKARILAVDDQRYFRELIEGLLTEDGYEVHTASGGEEALHCIEREDFDVIITDLVMPGIDGGELVDRIKESQPDQEIIMVTGVVDVKTAVEAMKKGVTDYILKPFDRKALASSLERILQRRRLSEEHSRLMAENLEYLGVLSLYERGLGLFRTLSLEPLAERLIEGLCLETRSQGGVIWVAEESGAENFRLAGARGLIRIDEEPEVLTIDDLDDDFEDLVEHGRSLVRRVEGSGGKVDEAFYVSLRHAGDLLAIARLSDKLEGEPFDERDRAAAEKFVSMGGVALANTLRFRALERRSFRDPVTKAYTHAYFQDVVRNEIQKASRFGHHFSILRIDLGSLSELQQHCSETQLARWLEDLAFHASSALRSTDLLAAEVSGRFSILLPETDTVGAAVLGRRVREAIERGGVLQSIDAELRPTLHLSCASYPSDGTQIESLERTLEDRIEEQRDSLVGEVLQSGAAFGTAIESLSQRGSLERKEVPAEVARFVLGEVGRRSRDHGLLFVSPGAEMEAAIRDGLEQLVGLDVQTEIVVMGERPADVSSANPVSWVPRSRGGTQQPFLLYYGDGPAYAMMSTPTNGGEDQTQFFHTGDRALVEHLVFQLQRDLGLPLSV